MSVFGIRLLLALAVVGLTYNPTGWSFFHWVQGDVSELGWAGLVDPVKTIAAIALLIGWVVLARATFRSLGVLGMLLVGGALAAIMWLLFDQKVLDAGNRIVWQWVGTLGIAFVLAIGTSWSMVRRKLTGQIDTDDISTD